MESLPNLSMSGSGGGGLVQYSTSHESNNRLVIHNTITVINSNTITVSLSPPPPLYITIYNDMNLSPFFVPSSMSSLGSSGQGSPGDESNRSVQ